MKQKLFENIGGNQFKLNTESSNADYKLAVEMEQKVVSALQQLENDPRFMEYLHKYPELNFNQTLRDAFSFVIKIKSA